MHSRPQPAVVVGVLFCLLSCRSASVAKSTPSWTPVWRGPDSAEDRPFDAAQDRPFDAAQDRPLFGVIRWDIFCGGDNLTNPELKSLSPLKYHDRVPYFLTIESDDKVSGTENDQAIIDRQIAYASAAGIDYWAFVTSPEMDPAGPHYYVLDKLLKSERKRDIGFCLILHLYYDYPVWSTRVQTWLGLFKEPTYVKVLGDRPLLFVFSIWDMERQYGSDTAPNLELLNRECVAAGLGKPYIVLCYAGADKARQYGLDAIGAYSNSGTGLSGGAFADLAASDRKTWAGYLRSGVKAVPLVTVGWNQRPRTDNPPPWGGGGPPYFEEPTPSEAAAHIREGLSFVENNPAVCDANTILCYAWNEFAEGGWLCPTLSEGTARLDAVRKMMTKKYGRNAAENE
jgi:hypothetical protein